MVIGAVNHNFPDTDCGVQLGERRIRIVSVGPGSELRELLPHTLAEQEGKHISYRNPTHSSTPQEHD